MIFKKGVTNNFDDPSHDYKVLCGIEEEFLIVDTNGTLINAADDIIVKAAEILEQNKELLTNLQLKIRGLDAEPQPSQIEYVTLPLTPSELPEAVLSGRKLLADAAKTLGLRILSQSMHPIQSDPNPMCGTHINVSVQRQIMNVEEIAAVYDYLWNHLPELIAISANSGLYKGSLTNIASNRIIQSTVLKPNGSSQILFPKQTAMLNRQQYYGRMRYTLQIGASEHVKRVITNPQGDRLVDITPRGPFTNIAEDKDSSLMTNRVEVRIFDVQQEIGHLINLAYLCCASALHAIYLYKKEPEKLVPDVYHKINVERAIYNGIETKFIRNKLDEENVIDSMKRWLEETKRYQELLGIKINDQITKKRGIKQAELHIEFKTEQIENIRQQGRIFSIVEFNKSRTVFHRGNKYGISKGSQLEGQLSVDYQLTFDEKDGIVTTFNGIKVVNTLDVQGISIPLESDDRILIALNRNEYLSRRFISNFGF